jgi:chemotaxis protein methyltransferase CheR
MRATGLTSSCVANVTIYFGEGATQRLYERFAEALEPAGWLLLGPSDPIPAATSGLELVPFAGALLWRRKVAALVGPPSPADRTQAVWQPGPQIGAWPPRLVVPPSSRPAAPAPHARVMSATLAARVNASMDPLVHLQAGMLRLGEGAPAAAIDSLRRASFLDQTSALVQFSLGRAYRQLGDPARSRAAFSRARRLLVGTDDDEPLAGGEGKVATGELGHAVDLQLADLDGPKP